MKPVKGFAGGGDDEGEPEEARLLFWGWNCNGRRFEVGGGAKAPLVLYKEGGWGFRGLSGGGGRDRNKKDSALGYRGTVGTGRYPYRSNPVGPLFPPTYNLTTLPVNPYP